jgi:hypothetical protein
MGMKSKLEIYCIAHFFFFYINYQHLVSILYVIMTTDKGKSGGTNMKQLPISINERKNILYLIKMFVLCGRYIIHIKRLNS